MESLILKTLARPMNSGRPLVQVCLVAAVALASAALMLILGVSSAEASDSGPRTIRNGSAPANGLVSFDLEEQWRRGDENDDLFFGLITAVVTDQDHRLYLLDAQLSTVSVLDADGQFLRNIGREGEGPGEFRRAWTLLHHPDGYLGVVQRFPGSIVNITPDGLPAGVILPGDPATGGRDMLSGARSHQLGLVLSGAHMTRRDDGRMRRNFLSLYGFDGIVITEYLGRDENFDFGANTIREADQDWIGDGRWDVLSDGRIVVGPGRDEYRLTVYEPDGTPGLEFSRESAAPLRTPVEMERLETRWKANRRAQRFGTEQEFALAEPMITLVRSRNDEIWILPATGQRNQPAGVLQTWDVFDTAGTWDRQVALRAPGDGTRDHVFFLDDHRVLVVAGFRDALDAMEGIGDDTTGSDDAPIEVILYHVN